jgi:transcriptional regulator CtsR
MRSNKVVILLLIVVIALAGIWVLWREFSKSRYLELYPSEIEDITQKPPILKEDIQALPETELLTEEDIEVLTEVAATIPLVKGDTQPLTSDDIQFLIENEIITKDEARFLLGLEKLMSLSKF